MAFHDGVLLSSWIQPDSPAFAQHLLCMFILTDEHLITLGVIAGMQILDTAGYRQSAK